MLMKELTIIFFCTWKFAATFPIAIIGMKMPFWETIFLTNLGGILGVVIFVFFSKAIIIAWRKLITNRFNYRNNKEKRIFTSRNRRIVRIKSKYGFAGIVILNPVILSIPVGSFLITRYYGATLKNLFWLVAGQVAWSFIYALFYIQLYSYFLNIFI